MDLCLPFLPHRHLFQCTVYRCFYLSGRCLDLVCAQPVIFQCFLHGRVDCCIGFCLTVCAYRLIQCCPVDRIQCCFCCFHLCLYCHLIGADFLCQLLHPGKSGAHTVQYFVQLRSVCLQLFCRRLHAGQIYRTSLWKPDLCQCIVKCREALFQKSCSRLQLAFFLIHHLKSALQCSGTLVQRCHTGQVLIQIRFVCFHTFFQGISPVRKFICGFFQLLHIIRHFIHIVQILQIHIFEKAGGKDRCGKIQRKIRDIRGHFHIFRNINILRWLIRRQFQAFRQSRAGISNDQLLSVNIHHFSIFHLNIGCVIVRQQHRGDRGKRDADLFFFPLDFDRLSGLILIIKPDLQLTAFPRQFFRFNRLTVEFVADTHIHRQLCASGSLIGNILPVIFPLDRSIPILCEGLVSFFVFDICQIGIILDRIAIAGIFQFCLYGDLPRIAFGIAFYINRFCLVFLFTVLFFCIFRRFGFFFRICCLLHSFCLRSLLTVR